MVAARLGAVLLLRANPRHVVAVGAGCSAVGGLCWVVKGAGILLTGVQPPIVYEVAPLFFPVASVGLWVLPGVRSRRADAGLVLAGLSEAAAVVSVLGLYLGPPSWIPTGSTPTGLSVFIALAMAATLASLLLLGIPTRRARALPGASRNLPIVIAVSVIPLIALGGLLESLRHHLLEAPVIVVGLGWVALAVALSVVVSRVHVSVS